jgi:hypothetical protein
MNAAREPLGELFQIPQVKGMVRGCEEARAAIVPALDDVNGDSSQSKAGAARHGG